MGQQPNIHLGIEDLPRPEAHPAPPRRWSPQRPGELGSPAEVPWGGGFGTPGPDAGYAYVVLAGRPTPAADGENPGDVVAVLAALMAARASRFGRAPVGEDADVAEMLLGYRPSDLPGEVVAALAAARRRWLSGFAHAKHRDRELVGSVASGFLDAPPSEIERRLRAGEVPIA